MTLRKKVLLTLKCLVVANFLCYGANLYIHQWALAMIALGFCLLGLAVHFYADLYL